MTDRIIQSWQTTATDDSNYIVKIASHSKLSTEKKLHCLGLSGKTQWENIVALLYLIYTYLVTGSFAFVQSNPCSSFYTLLSSVNIFCSSDNAKGPFLGRVVIRRRFYKLPSVILWGGFSTPLWGFLSQVFATVGYSGDSVSQPCQVIGKLQHSHCVLL